MNKQFSRIKLLLTDIDGVWTDGGMYYNEKGEVMKKFNTRDGMGVARLREIGIETIIISSENTDIVRARAKKLNIKNCYIGVKNKTALLEEICKNFKITHEEIAYIGDDVNDLGIIKRVGYSSCPKDAFYEVKSIVDYVCSNGGGSGAFREFAELIIREKSNV